MIMSTLSAADAMALCGHHPVANRRSRMQRNIEQLHNLENDYEKVREQLSPEQQAVFEDNLHKLREKW